jgi:hypothetical protein
MQAQFKIAILVPIIFSLHTYAQESSGGSLADLRKSLQGTKTSLSSIKTSMDELQSLLERSALENPGDSVSEEKRKALQDERTQLELALIGSMTQVQKVLGAEVLGARVERFDREQGQAFVLVELQDEQGKATLPLTVPMAEVENALRADNEDDAEELRDVTAEMRQDLRDEAVQLFAETAREVAKEQAKRGIKSLIRRH